MSDDLQAQVERLARQVEELEDRRKIQEAIYRYCRGADRTDVEVFAQSFWDDGGYAGADFEAPGRAADFIKTLVGEHLAATLAATQHLIGNILIELSGEEAHCESYAIAYHRSHPTPEGNAIVLGAGGLEALEGDPHEPHDLIIGFRYLDHFQKRDGEWRIKLRRLVFDWGQAWPSLSRRTEGIWKGATSLRGARMPDDPSYATDCIGGIKR